MTKQSPFLAEIRVQTWEKIYERPQMKYIERGFQGRMRWKALKKGLKQEIELEQPF